MKQINGRHYTEVNDKRYIIHANEDIKLREREPPNGLKLNIKYGTIKKLEYIKKLLKRITMN